VGQLDRVKLGDLLSAGDYDRDGSVANDLLESLTVVGLDEMGAELGANAACETEIARVACHFLAHCGNRQHGDAVLVTVVDQLGQVEQCRALALPADEDGQRDRRGVQTNRVLDGHGQPLAGQLAQDARSAGDTQDDGRFGGRWNALAQDAARQHQRVCVREQRLDGLARRLEARRRSEEISVVDRQHHRAAGLRIQDPAETVLHSPIHDC
jgi:hypothetical protein